MNYKDIFSNIYDNHGFGSLESRSGPGSTLDETKKLRESIKKIIKDKNIKSVVDIPCGDFNWMKEIVFNFESYIGGDIVKKAIEENNERYSNSRIKFIEFDIVNDEIPNGDLLIVRDIIGHFPIDDGIKILKNILNSKCKYLLSTTWAKKIGNDWFPCEKNDVHRENEGVDYGRFYPVNLMSNPFNLPNAEIYLEEDVMVDNFENGNRKTLALWDLDKIRNKTMNTKQEKKNTTIVTGLWDINRQGRDFQHYIDNFKLFLDIPQNLFIYIESKYEHIVWEKRDKSNTFVKTYELSDIKNLYAPHWDKTQEIRTNPNWVNLASWLGGSPQASLEWYNPIVQSKMFMLNDASIWNPFDSEYLFWLDAGITNTVPHTHFVENNVLDSISNYGNPFLFLSYPYEAANEIHGFEIKAMNMFAGADVKYVCRGGLFGGHKDQIRDANSTYYSLLQRTLNSGYMGTEESLFTIMSYNEPELYQRYELDGNGLVVKFTQAIIDNNVKLAEVLKPKITNTSRVTDRDVLNYKTNLYMLTFNFPKQILHTIKSMEKTPEWLTRPNLVLLDNSTNEDAKIENKKIAEDYNFEYVDLGGNTGICGGRQAAAEHFDNSDSDFMFFFEDDMTVNPPEMVGEVCRNGFMKYVPNLYNILHKIMLKDGFDFVKLTFTEVYFDNDKQCSWYNVPQNIRSRDWPNYDKLPVTGLDPNAPLTNFKNIRVIDGVSYIDGEVYYANWPMIVSKSGNKKMFIDTKWAHPYEQTWMSHMYQMTKEGNLKPAILLAAPIWHDRIMHYTPEERREN
ncbi:MAG: glycosyltransferase [Chitinophagaceae bacterium]|nr:glycosyltransferase [Chitinophagaceae bacterium]